MDFYRTVNLILLILFLSGMIFSYKAGERQGFENHRRLTRKHTPKYYVPSKSTPKRVNKKKLKIDHRRYNG